MVISITIELVQNVYLEGLTVTSRMYFFKFNLQKLIFPSLYYFVPKNGHYLFISFHFSICCHSLRVTQFESFHMDHIFYIFICLNIRTNVLYKISNSFLLLFTNSQINYCMMPTLPVKSLEMIGLKRNHIYLSHF